MSEDASKRSKKLTPLEEYRASLASPLAPGTRVVRPSKEIDAPRNREVMRKLISEHETQVRAGAFARMGGKAGDLKTLAVSKTISKHKGLADDSVTTLVSSAMGVVRAAGKAHAAIPLLSSAVTSAVAAGGFGSLVLSGGFLTVAAPVALAAAGAALGVVGVVKAISLAKESSRAARADRNAAGLAASKEFANVDPSPEAALAVLKGWARRKSPNEKRVEPSSITNPHERLGYSLADEQTFKKDSVLSAQAKEEGFLAELMQWSGLEGSLDDLFKKLEPPAECVNAGHQHLADKGNDHPTPLAASFNVNMSHSTKNKGLRRMKVSADGSAGIRSVVAALDTYVEAITEANKDLTKAMTDSNDSWDDDKSASAVEAIKVMTDAVKDAAATEELAEDLKSYADKIDAFNE